MQLACARFNLKNTRAGGGLCRRLKHHRAGLTRHGLGHVGDWPESLQPMTILNRRDCRCSSIHVRWHGQNALPPEGVIMNRHKIILALMAAVERV